MSGFQNPHTNLTLGYLDRGNLKITKVIIVCGVSPVRDVGHLIGHLISSDDLDLQEHLFGWRHESAIPAISGVLELLVSHWIDLYRRQGPSTVCSEIQLFVKTALLAFLFVYHTHLLNSSL